MEQYFPNELAEYFEYLDTLRESGATNMYGAGAYLQDEFGIERKEASEILTSWMKTFSDDTPLDRASKAISA